MPVTKELSYGRTSVSAARRALDSGKKIFEQEYSLGGGAHILRILPPKKDGPFFFEFMLHYLPGGVKAVCPSTFSKACPVCVLGNKLFKSDDPEEVAQGKKLYHRKAYLCNAVDCRQPKGVNVLRMGKNLVSDLIELFGDENDPEDEGVDFTDPSKNGANIRIKVIMNEGDFPRYVPKIVKTGVPVPFANWLKELLDLPKLVESKILPQAELAALVADVDFEDEDDPKPKAKVGKGKVVEDDDSDDDDSDTDSDEDKDTDSDEDEDETEKETDDSDEDEDSDSDSDKDTDSDDDDSDSDDEDSDTDSDDDDEDDKPAAKGKGKVAAKADDDDDAEDADEEEDDDDPPPPPKNKKPAPAVVKKKKK